MSAVNELSHIKDEDLLKKMWQDTEDFGKKKEIRAHMYKLREERLKDLYCNSDVITSKKSSFNQSMHTDALADHSFASLKRKEIRDSESPTKDVSYRIKGSSGNDGWNISKIEEHSQDGKSHKFSQSAQRSGTEYIPHGKLDYQAKNSQEVTSFQDGDDKNFVKSQGTSSNSYICQEAVGGDGNSTFKTSSTKSSTSSRTVTEQKSSVGDAIEYPSQQLVVEGVNRDTRNNLHSSNISTTVTNEKTSFGDSGDYQNKRIIIEAVGSNDQNNYRTSTTNQTSRTVTEQKAYDDYRKLSNISDDLIVDKTTKVYTTDAPRELKSHPGYVEGRTKVTRETKTLADGTVVTTTKYETKGGDEVKSTSSNQYISSSSSFRDNKSNVVTSRSDEKTSNRKVIDNVPKNVQGTSRYYVEKTHTIPDTTENINIYNERDSKVTERRSSTTNNQQRYETTKTDTTNTDVRKQSIRQIDIENDTNIQRRENVRKETIDNNKVQQKTIATHDVNSVPLGTPIEIEINLTRMNDNQEKKYTSKNIPSNEAPKTQSPLYDTPTRREPIKHQDEMTTKTKSTDGQYDTTYRTDYTNKKISIEVSPTHDAFARSLRAVSPDRLSSRNRNLKNSNSSLRSSSSPEKSYYDRKYPQRVSPDRYTNGRCRSPPKKTPEKFSSTETITYKRPMQRVSPDTTQKRRSSTEIKLTSRKVEKIDEKNTNIINRNQQSPPKNKRPSVPNGTINYVYEITTDLDDNSSTYSHSTATTNKTHANLDSKTTKEFYIHEPKKPVDVERPKAEPSLKDKPIDRPLKRTDTYEERCRQILGITGDSNERRRSSLEKLRKRGSTLDALSKTSQPEEAPGSKKPNESPRQKSPTKQVPLQEFPSQIRRSPEKLSPERRTPNETPPKDNRRPSTERKPIQEFPSQIRRTPEKPDERSSPSRNYSRKTPEKQPNQNKPIQEFPSQIRRTPEKIETDKPGRRPSNVQKPVETYPGNRSSPDKRDKQSPSRSTPKKTITTNREDTVDTTIILETTINKQQNNIREQVNTTRDNIYENVKTDTRKINDTFEVDVKPSQTKQYPHERKSPKKLVPDSPKQQVTTDIKTTDRNNIQSSFTITSKKEVQNEQILNENKNKKFVHKNPESAIKKPDDDTSSDEENVDIVEDVIYDTPKNRPVDSKKSAETEERNANICSEIDQNQESKFDVKRIITDYVSEDEQNFKNHLVETIIDNENTPDARKKLGDEPENTSFPKPTSQPSAKSPTKPQLGNRDLLISKSAVSTKEVTEDKTNQNITQSKTVGELVKHFIVKESEPVDQIKKTDGKSPVSNRTTSRVYENVDIGDTKRTTDNFIVTESNEEICNSSIESSKRNSISSSPDKKIPQKIQPCEDEPKDAKQSTSILKKTPSDKEFSKKPSSQKTPTSQKPEIEEDVSKIDLDSVTIISSMTDERMRNTSIKKPNIKPSLKKPSDNTDELIESIEVDIVEEEIDSKVEKSSNHNLKTKETNKTSESNIFKTPQKQTRPLNSEKIETFIDVEETMIIESDEEVNEPTETSKSSPSQTVRKIIHIEDELQVEENGKESEHEFTEIEFATIKRKPNNSSSEPTTPQTPNKNRPRQSKVPQKYNKSMKTQDDEETREKRTKVTEQKRVQTVVRTEKPTQRTPSSSSLIKKPNNQQKVTKVGEVETKKHVSNVRKINEPKQVKPDLVRNKPNEIPIKQSPAKPYQKPIAKKTIETIKNNRKLINDYPDDSSEAEEEMHTKKHVMETYEGRTPVEEPLMIKKTVSLLGSDDEDDKKTTQLLIESEIVETQPVTDKKAKPVKSPKTISTKLINVEKNEVNIQKNKSYPTRMGRTPTDKKSEIPKQQSLQRKDLITTKNKNTLKDIETFENVKIDKTIHLRTNRVDETVNKKKTSALKIDTPKSTNKSPQLSTTPKTPSKATPKKPAIETFSTKNIQKPKESTKQVEKTIPQKITKSDAKAAKTNIVKVKSEEITTKSKTIKNKVEEPEDSDEESIPDSLNESVCSSISDLTGTINKRVTQRTSVEATKFSDVSSKIQRSEEKPKMKEPKKYIPSKSISRDRGTVDLQRSISSREATPDRVFPLPVTSDDEEVAPRYPDNVVEPDDANTKRRFDRLFETSIHEHGDTIQSKKIVEIGEDKNQRVTGIDRVDNDDESLMTVDRKINKFLSTAEKLTEKPIVDISQPAPKVQRPKFEVNDDLKEDDCLLSVSDKVQKFITEAEYLTTQKDNQHRKSVNIDVKSEVSNRINQFTLPHQKETSPRTPETPKNVPISPEKEPKQLENSLKLDQDVFITTECAQIEKESDLFRTTKQTPIRPKDEPVYDTPRPLDKTTPRRTSGPNKSPIEKDELSSPDDTASKPKKNYIKEFTPKTRRPSQEEKVILSSVGRLRSNESIKKAKALFDNTESTLIDQDILNRPSVFEGRNKTVKETNVKKTIDRNNVTPKRLVFTSEKETEERGVIKETTDKDVPRYMKPLNRRSQSRDQTPEPHEGHPVSNQPKKNQRPEDDSDIPGYMKPLDRSVTHQHNQEGNHQEVRKHSLQSHETPHYTTNVDTPGYMKPLDRSDKHHHTEISSTDYSQHVHSEEDHHKRYTMNEDKTPHYMMPLDRSDKHHHSEISIENSQEQRYTDDSTEDDHHKRYTTNGDKTPHYMKPLDRSDKHHHSEIYSSDYSQEHRYTDKHLEENHQRYTSNEYEIPHYMTPLDRSHQHHHESSSTIDRHDHRHSVSDVDTHKHYTSTDWTYKTPKHSIPDDQHSTSSDWKYKTRPNEDGTPGYMKPLDRTARPQFEPLERSKSPDTQRYQKPDDQGDSPGYMKPLDRSNKPEPRERSKSPETHRPSNKHPKAQDYEPTEEDVPSYMKPLDRSTKPQYDQRDRSKSPEGKYRRPQSSRSGSPKKEVPTTTTDGRPKESQTTSTKFGVTLKRTDSGKAITSSFTSDKSQKKHPILLKKNIAEEEIDEIYDLEILEELLLKYTIYEIRRKIRTQIRIVKKLISEGKLEITIQNLRNKSKSTEQTQRIKDTEREPHDVTNSKKNISSRKTQETHTVNRSDIEIKTKHDVSESRRESYTSQRIGNRESTSPDKKIPERKPSTRATPERASPERKPSKPTSEKIITEQTTSYQTTYTTRGNTAPKSSLKKTEPKAKAPLPSSQPEWVTQRNLKKVETNEVVKKSSNTVKKQSTKARTTDEVESTDLIASSYGIGPTDENGAPLFGLRALRAQNTNGTTKVQGTVISSQYYSETGKEPVGQISVTKYSSDPRDMGCNENLTQNGDILSVTTTQKYGFDDTPSLKQLPNTDKETCDSRTNRRKSSTKTSTITRKNSVKALTQKFVENAVEVSKSERQPSYPKAGLILRSSSFKNESETDDSYSAVSAEERTEKSVSVKSSKLTSGGTFLRNKSKVTGVQDAISRMKAEDIEYEDTEEEIQAKDLLNKYLGSQVILSGIEGQISRTGTATSSSSSFAASAKSTSRITTVTTENGKEVTKTRTFEHPVSDEVLETVWDEQTLRYLLDQSTDYDERKRFRARLRLIMAEQEACTELVKQASQEQSSQSIDESIETSKEVISEGPVTTTKVTRVSTQQHVSKKPMSPFAKFRQLDKQNSLNTPPSTPRTPGGSPLFKFTDAALSQSASTIKDRLLYWCRMKTKEYENIQLDNFSSSWADGLAFCALIHHFLPDAFDYHALTPKERRHNFTLAFKVADEKADIAPLLDVDDMVATMRPDWKCVFTYVQSIYRRFKDED